jgi:hemolysin activation/secretion protein
MKSAIKMICFGVVSCALWSVVCAADTDSANTVEDEVAPHAKYEKARADFNEIAELYLPEDTSRQLTVKQVRMSGNSLISTAKLMKKMPLIHSTSGKSLRLSEPEELYDFRVLREVVWAPGPPRQVSTRTIKGFAEYILSVYQKKGYGGIYVYVPEEAIAGEVVQPDGILPVVVVEAHVSAVAIRSYDAAGEEVNEGHLRKSVVESWSPAQVGEVLNQKKLDDFINLLNLNPDRYVSGVVSEGNEPNSLDLGYEIYEAEPWHYYIQVDNSGTRERQWAPRVGVMNTNLTGIDDRFTAMYQAPWEKGIEENYAVFGSYDFPVFAPWLRLNLYGGYTEFDVTPEGGPFNFLGRGSFYGGILRYNVLQKEGWFVDVVGSLSHEESKVSPEIFPAAGSDVDMDLLGFGVNAYRSTDISNTSAGLSRIESIDASDADEFEAARTGSDPDFTIWMASASHSRYMDQNKVQRLSGTLRWIGSDERLVPAKMTAFGGLYSVRGYDEYEVVADGGIIASAQYEFDLVKYEQSKEGGEGEGEEAGEEESETEELRLRKLAPLAFIDIARAKIKDEVAGEREITEFFSVGVGTIAEIGDNFSGAVYYGYPIRQTENTREGKGRLSISLILRW